MWTVYVLCRQHVTTLFDVRATVLVNPRLSTSVFSPNITFHCLTLKISMISSPCALFFAAVAALHCPTLVPSFA